ncbi:hypothetical protein ABBQ32_011335 [Trebouxia sp. C0010 RCD-2024]
MTDTSGVLIVRGPRDALGSEFSLVQNADGMWNATLMGTQGGRAWKDFLRNDRTKAYIKELEEQLGLPESSVVRYERAEKGPGGSTWIHRRLAFQFIAHQSPKFAVWADGVIERYIDGKITTEESKAAKAAYDAVLENGRIKYEESQKQLQAAQKEIAIADGRRKLAEAGQKKFWRQVDHATAEVDDLKKQLGLKRQTATKRKRAHDGKVFLQELSRVVQEYRDGVTGPWLEVEERLEKSIPEFLAYLNEVSGHRWTGKDLTMFGELPTKKGNPKQWNVVFADAETGSCRYDNIRSARNHETKAKLWQAGADGMEGDE